jgi:lysophospholipid acyltransferase (LPLAT)-like uncharacterized protein
MLRRVIRHPRTQAFLAGLLSLYILAIFRTMRWSLVGGEHVVGALAAPPGQPPGAPPPAAIFAFWHERLPLMAYSWRLGRREHAELRARKLHVLVSRHRDGRLIGDIVSRFDIPPVHASSSKGGATGLRHLLRLLGAGESVGITPDGPRGPRREAAPGVAQLAGLSGAVILPCAGACRPAIRLNSWDRMLLPLPFSRGVVLVLPPVRVPREDPLASLPAIEAAMNEACARADAWVAA